jgi:hypothetical protein
MPQKNQVRAGIERFLTDNLFEWWRLIDPARAKTRDEVRLVVEMLVLCLRQEAVEMESLGDSDRPIRLIVTADGPNALWGARLANIARGAQWPPMFIGISAQEVLIFIAATPGGPFPAPRTHEWKQSASPGKTLAAGAVGASLGLLLGTLIDHATSGSIDHKPRP